MKNDRIGKQNIIKMADKFVTDCGDEYTFYAVTGHFGNSDHITSRQGYAKKWQEHEPKIRGVFSRLSRKFTGIRNWGESSRHREMKVLAFPEINGHLHMHGIMGVPMEDTEFNLLRVNSAGEKAWRLTFANSSFVARKLYDDGGWLSYDLKTYGYGDIIDENFMVMPFCK